MTPLLIINATNADSPLPKRFRRSRANISGSGQFSALELTHLKTICSPHMTVIDLREEPHFFLDQQPVSYHVNHNNLNRHLSAKQIALDEHRRIHTLSSIPQIELHQLNDKETLERETFFIEPKHISTEKELCTSLDINYLRLPITDHTHPTLEQCLTLQKLLNEKTHFHFHCSAGCGRTTTMLVIVDIILSTDPLEKIIKKHQTLSNYNLFASPDPTDWKAPLRAQREAFIRDTYNIIRKSVKK